MNQAAHILEIDPDQVFESVLISICEQNIAISTAKQAVQVRKISFGFLKSKRYKG